MSDREKTILLVEDNDQNRMLFHDLLEARGYKVLEARTGMEGWQVAQERHPEMILMDIQLPDISGLEVTQWLKSDETLKSIPVVAVTIFATEIDRRHFLAKGCDGFIPKPITVSNFLETVESFAA